MNYSIIDLGSNTVRLSVYRCDGQSLQVLFSRKVNLGLAGYIQGGILSEIGILRAIGVLRMFQDTLSNLNLEKPHVLATASLRNIDNRTEAQSRIEQAIGLPIDILSGEEEARFSFLGTRMEHSSASSLVVDIGGGSAEITLSNGEEIIEAISLPLGSLNLIPKEPLLGKNRILMSKAEHKRVRGLVETALKDYPKLRGKHVPTMIGVGGTIRATGRLNQEVYQLPPEDRYIEATHIKEMTKLLIDDETVGLDLILRTAPDRVKTLLYGMTILQTIVKHFRCENVLVSRFGVREGYLLERLLVCKSGDPLPKWSVAMSESDWERYPELDAELQETGKDGPKPPLSNE